MKRVIIISAMAFTIITAAFSQSKMSADTKLKQQMIDLENAGWNAFKTKDAAWFKVNTTDDYLQITDEGVFDKTEVISSLTDCTVRSFSLDQFRMVKLTKSTLLLIYRATQDGICGDDKLPAKVQVSVNYVKRGGRWLEAFYMDTPVAE